MSEIASGPLPALISYYERLERDPEQAVASFGFSREKIHFQIVLERDGQLASFDDLRETNERGKPMPTLMLVPDGGGRSGVGMKPFFCWDNTGYALGRDNKGKPARAEEMFASFRELHLSFRERLDGDEGFDALCRFLERWNPAEDEALPRWEEAAGLNVVFRLRGREEFVHQSPSVQQVWRQNLNTDAGDVLRGVSLISGQEEDLARLHPLVSGVAGTNTTGAAIVSFNLDAFTSYGKSQSYNAPVGIRDTFRYTTALNRLLADNARRVRIGDATVVFWTDRTEARDAEDIFGAIFGEDAPPDDPAECRQLLDRLHGFLNAARRGQLSDHLNDPQAPFYVLGLSPNASRINVRYWLTGTVNDFAKSLAAHLERLEIITPKAVEGDPPLMIRRILWETAREPKEISPQLAGEVARSILSGLPYPHALFGAVIRRVRIDRQINHRRAAILKAYLIRNHAKEVPVALNKDHLEQTYHLGRLFAAIERTQEDASGGKLNATIKDRFFGSAGATPASIFPRLLRLHQHHLNGLPNAGMRVNREKLIGEICGHIQRFPSHLSLEQQGMFYVGYYHQYQDFFTKRAESTKEVNDEQ